MKRLFMNIILLVIVLLLAIPASKFLSKIYFDDNQFVKEQSVINKKTIERLWIISELFFLKTPKINKNIIENEIKNSGEI